MIGYRIKVTGLVQGIGFRPFVAELAEELHLAGQVKNLGGIVEIIVFGTDKAMDMFIHRLNLMCEKTSEHLVFSEQFPVLGGCRIDSIEIQSISDNAFFIQENGIQENHFQIVESGNTKERKRFLPVDLSICDRCRSELYDKKNRRYRYPFISCTACGPRFSIQTSVPYDRNTITMDIFPMCEDCKQEYTQKGNIRRHAQTISCHNCGPILEYKTIVTDDYFNINKYNKFNYKSNFENVEFIDSFQEKTYIQQKAIFSAISDLKNGKIGAMKDIGGFHFAFSPYFEETAKRLRAFKNRDKKPFAVMFSSLDMVKEYCEVSHIEEKLLLSNERPIVLLKKKKDFVSEICGESDRMGVLLPCNPLQILLLEELGVFVMTSGNRGGEPIIISEKEMEQYLGNGIDFMLSHNREILTPLDDSIYQVVGEKVQIIRQVSPLRR